MNKNAVTASRQQRRPQSVIIGLLVALLASTSGTLRADAIIINQAMKAVSIAQYYVEEEGVRLDLEIGLAELGVFRNLLPDDVYQEITGEQRPLAERLAQFFAQDLMVVADSGVVSRSQAHLSAISSNEK